MMMHLMLVTAVISIFLPILMLLMAFCIPQTQFDFEKLSPFECGFHPISSSQLPFSMRFFLVAILFLLFDLEIALLLPLPWGIQLHTPLITFTLALTILTFLTFGFIYEWVQGGLEWSD